MNTQSENQELDVHAPRSQSAPVPVWVAPAAGLIGAVVAVCVSVLGASVLNTISPLTGVANEFIDRTPKWLKEFAISAFGTNDKVALAVGMATTIAVFAMVLGKVARTKPAFGSRALYSFGVFGALISMNRPNENLLAAVPPMIGAFVGAAVVKKLMVFVRSADSAEVMTDATRSSAGWQRRQFVSSTSKTLVGATVAVGVARGINGWRDTQAQNVAANAGTPNNTDALVANVVSPAPTVPANATLSPITPFVTPNRDFYRIDTAFMVPRVNVDKWSLEISGRVNTPLRLTYEDLLKRPHVERMITICCVSNEIGGDLIGNAVWQGVLLADLLKEAGVQPEASQVFGTSEDGWTCGFPVQMATDGRDAMIALFMNGEKLPKNHGFPARMIVPGLYGYVSATKWLKKIELTKWDEATGYWIPRGWSREAPVKTQSRIDVPKRGATVTAGTTPIAGIAWAQHRGISKVEVRIDDGEWREARMSAEVTTDVWTQWILDWEATPGNHVIAVRATDKDGDTQTEQVARVDPDGATGWHTRTVTVRA